MSVHFEDTDARECNRFYALQSARCVLQESLHKGSGVWVCLIVDACLDMAAVYTLSLISHHSPGSMYQRLNLGGTSGSSSVSVRAVMHVRVEDKSSYLVVSRCLFGMAHLP